MKLKGKPHSKGGININVEGGEYIIKKDSVNASTEPILEEINKTGKLEYKKGGKIMPTVKDEQGNVVDTSKEKTTKKEKTSSGKKWSKASKKASELGYDLGDLVSKRKLNKKGSDEYNKIQDKIKS